MREVVEKISQVIASHGPIPFSEFMEMALYCPDHGYYEKEEDTIGRGGDYYTSVSVGKLFGELLAARFAHGSAEDQTRVQWVEAGAHKGLMANDMLEWLSRWRPGLFERLEYWLVEPSMRRREWQRRALAAWEGKVRWTSQVSDLARTSDHEGVCGIIFSNEFLDAFPVRRLVWDARLKRWGELGVTLHQGQFAWTRLDFGDPGRAKGHFLPPPRDEMTELLPDGYVVDLCPTAAAWWAEAAAALSRGRLVTLDYGLTRDEMLSPEREGGTLRGYSRHRLSANPLASPGDQDLTAHVDFTAIQAAGEAAGLVTETFETQGRFLTRVAAGIWEGKVAFEPWTQKHSRQFLTLTHPDHLGSRFRVLVQRTVDARDGMAPAPGAGGTPTAIP